MDQLKLTLTKNDIKNFYPQKCDFEKFCGLYEGIGPYTTIPFLDVVKNEEIEFRFVLWLLRATKNHSQVSFKQTGDALAKFCSERAKGFSLNAEVSNSSYKYAVKFASDCATKGYKATLFACDMVEWSDCLIRIFEALLAAAYIHYEEEPQIIRNHLIHLLNPQTKPE